MDPNSNNPKNADQPDLSSILGSNTQNPPPPAQDETPPSASPPPPASEPSSTSFGSAMPGLDPSPLSSMPASPALPRGEPTGGPATPTPPPSLDSTSSFSPTPSSTSFNPATPVGGIPSDLPTSEPTSSLTPPTPAPSNDAPAWPASPAGGPPTSPIEPAPPPPSAPSFNPAPAEDTSMGSAQTPLSALDNPLGVPSQPPAIDGTSPTTSPDWSSPNPAVPSPIPEAPAISSSEGAAPTDLSHLINNEPAASPTPEATPAAYTPPVQPETLVVPPDGNTATPNIPTEGEHHGFPKWLIGLGIGLFLAVVGATGYFVLGIGQSAQPTVSAPAVTTPSKLSTPTAAPTPPVEPTPIATGSGSFGTLGGATPTPQATSAADLIKQRQGR